MKRTLFIVAVLVAFATAASGATLSVVSDKSTYNVGETITLTVSGDDQGATTYGIFGSLQYDGALVDNGTRAQAVLQSAGRAVDQGRSVRHGQRRPLVRSATRSISW